MKCETVKVKPWGKGQGDFVEINAGDFNPKIHEKFSESGSGSGQTVAELREILTEAGVEFAAKATKSELLELVEALDSGNE